MTGETENLVLEVLKRLQNDVTAMRTEMRSELHGVRVEMNGIKQHIAAFMAHDVNQDSEIAAMKVRLDRIERRLDLVD